MYKDIIRDLRLRRSNVSRRELLSLIRFYALPARSIRKRVCEREILMYNFMYIARKGQTPYLLFNDINKNKYLHNIANNEGSTVKQESNFI